MTDKQASGKGDPEVFHIRKGMGRMNVVLGFISAYGNAVIMICGVVVTGLLLHNAMALGEQKNKIKEALERRNKRYKLRRDRKELEEADDESAAITPDTIRKYETEFNKKCAWHGVLVQCIPIFPLLGILGTVAGLMLEVQAEDMAAMLASLDVALGTTLWGLIFAIALKFIEAVYPSRIIYEVEVMLDDFDKKMNMAEMFHKFSEEN